MLSGWLLIALAAFVAGATAVQDGDRVLIPAFILSNLILAFDLIVRRRS